MKGGEWIDRVVKEQRVLLGRAAVDLIADAARAEELFSLDELEEYAAELRRRERKGDEQ